MVIVIKPATLLVSQILNKKDRGAKGEGVVGFCFFEGKCEFFVVSCLFGAGGLSGDKKCCIMFNIWKARRMLMNFFRV